MSTLLSKLGILLSNLLVFQKNFCIALLYNREVLVLHIHTVTHICIGRSHCQTVKYALHVVVVGIDLFIQTEDMLIHFVLTSLVEDTQHHVQTVVDLSVQPRYLYDDAVVCQTLHEGIGQTFRHHVAIIVVRLVMDIDDWLLDVAHFMSQQIDGNGGQRIVAFHVLRVRVVHAEILAEAQRLGLKPRLLQLYENQMLRAVVLADGGSEVDTIDRKRVALVVGIFMWAHFHLYHILLQQRRENGAGNALVFHQILEDDVVNRIGYYHICCTFVCKDSYFSLMRQIFTDI